MLRKYYFFQLCFVFCKYIRKEYRATASWRHLVYFEFRVYVYSEKCTVDPIKFWSEHGGQQSWNSAFLQITLFFGDSVHIFARNYNCVHSQKKKSYCAIFFYTAFGILQPLLRTTALGCYPSFRKCPANFSDCVHLLCIENFLATAHKKLNTINLIGIRSTV